MRQAGCARRTVSGRWLWRVVAVAAVALLAFANPGFASVKAHQFAASAISAGGPAAPTPVAAPKMIALCPCNLLMNIGSRWCQKDGPALPAPLT